MRLRIIKAFIKKKVAKAGLFYRWVRKDIDNKNYPEALKKIEDEYNETVKEIRKL